MIILIAGFIFALGLTYVFFKNRISPSFISIPLPTQGHLPSPTSIPSPSVVQINEIESDLNNISADLKKVKENSRLNPPLFLFDLGLSN